MQMYFVADRTQPIARMVGSERCSLLAPITIKGTRGEQATRFRVSRALIYPHVPVLFMLEPARSSTGEEANSLICIVFPSIPQNQPRPPPGELTEAALEHFIAPGFAMKCGSS